MVVKNRSRLNSMEVLILLTLFVGGTFSYYQLFGGLFYCGLVQAGAEIHFWLVLSGIQSLLFLAQGLSVKISTSYRTLQLLALPFLFMAIGQVAVAYPRIFVCITLLIVFYWYTVWVITLFHKRSFGGSELPNLGSAITETIIFLLATFVIHSIIAFAILHTPSLFLDDRTFFITGTVSAIIAVWIVGSELPCKSLSIIQVPPLALLIIILLRAKFPDLSYDTLFYKATLPIMIADWRTAITGGLDHTLLGTNFLEIMNAQLRILDSTYSPALTSTFAFLALWVIGPVAMRSLTSIYFGQTKEFTCNIAVLLLVSLTEPLVSAGSAYHEPMLGLLVVASFLVTPVSWLFMGAAVASKITVVFILPIIFGLKMFFTQSLAKYPSATISLSLNHLLITTYQMFRNLFFSDVPRSKNRFAVLLICVLLSLVVVSEQFYRNFAYSGRLLGVTETLSSFTDPDNRKLAKPTANLFDVVMSRGLKEKVGYTFIHILTLNRWIKPTELGFHILPSSRLIAMIPIITLIVLAFPLLRQNRLILFSFITWNLCAFALLNFFSQGRHLFTLSLGAAILIALIVGETLKAVQVSSYRFLKAFFVLVIVFAAMGDQVVGSFINTGWDCRRNIMEPVAINNFDQPETVIEKKLKDIVGQYRAQPTSNLGNSPTILCESQIERMHYLGVHYIYAGATLDLNLRHLTANKNHYKIMPTSLLAICFKDPSFPNQFLSPDVRKEYAEVEGAEGVRILVSKPLMSGSKSTSLVGNQMEMLPWVTPSFDFIENWSLGRLDSNLHVDTPGGKGAFISGVEGKKTGILITPFRITFQNIPFKKTSQLEVELAMLYSSSDGMSVEIILENANGIKQTERFDLKAKPEGITDPAWEIWRFPIRKSLTGEGTLTVAAVSSTGDTSADWVVFRKLKLIMVK
jgi:hypothetical protein